MENQQKTIYYYASYQFNNYIEPTETIYSDRLFQWDSKKYDELCKKYFGNIGQSFGDRDAKKIEQFLSEYIGVKIVLCRVEKLENQSSGYPYWRFDYNQK